ncbi:MAG: BspA family leucine-rich repeat surface protein, partial [Lachnospiraceae bacterium]|nr:BspA family leucine-rich repeat surface protein [Lachnospiraceae bacterium]
MGVLYGEGKKIEEDPNKIIDSNNPVLQSWESSDRTDFHSNEYRSKITKAKFAICDKVPENKIESWDVSEAKNKSVMAWVESDGADGYILTIASKTKIIANPISNYIFYQMTNLTEVENIEVLDTSMVKQFDSMFRNCENLTNLDLSSLSFKNVKSVRYMFSGCTNLNNLKLSEINYKSGIDNSIEFWSMF